MNPLLLGLLALLSIGSGAATNSFLTNKYKPANSTPTPTPTPTPQSSFGRLSYYLPTGNQTATGTNPVSGYTAAVSPNLAKQIPMGTLIRLPNGQVVRVEDLTAQTIKDTLDLFYSNAGAANYPEQGLMRNVPYETIGRDTSGLRYNY